MLIKTLVVTTLVRMVIQCAVPQLGSYAVAASDQAVPPAHETMTPVDARTAVAQMTPGTNIGNTLDNTAHWETGWGSPLITREYVQSLAKLGFKSVRLPVAWDTYADHGRITPEEFRRVSELVNWITEAGMYCVLNIHWDGGWIDSSSKDRYPQTYHTFSPEAESKFRSYWEQISHFFAGKNQKLIFEALNEESSFTLPETQEPDYATLTRVNQLFVDTVRRTGGNNANRLLLVAGYSTDISKTCSSKYKMPRDTVPGRLFISVHYYTPWPFVGMNEDASWAKMQPTWGSEKDIKQLNQLFDTMNDFCVRQNTPAIIGEFSVCSDKDAASVTRWTNAVANAAVRRKMVPVLWDTGGGVSRREPYEASNVVIEMLRAIRVRSASVAK